MNQEAEYRIVTAVRDEAEHEHTWYVRRAGQTMVTGMSYESWLDNLAHRMTTVRGDAQAVTRAAASVHWSERNCAPGLFINEAVFVVDGNAVYLVSMSRKPITAGPGNDDISANDAAEDLLAC